MLSSPMLAVVVGYDVPFNIYGGHWLQPDAVVDSPEIP